jgi:hypothetical protein
MNQEPSGNEKSGMLLADVTGPNTSVIHEVGVACGMDKLTLFIANSEQEYCCPANLQGLFVIPYKPEGENWRQDFLEGLGDLFMKACLRAATKNE